MTTMVHGVGPLVVVAMEIEVRQCSILYTGCNFLTSSNTSAKTPSASGRPGGVAPVLDPPPNMLANVEKKLADALGSDALSFREPYRLSYSCLRVGSDST